MRILICEDHPMCREGFVMAFRQAAPEAEIERSGSLSEADQIIDLNPAFDLVLTDLMLPDSDGLKSLMHFCQRLPNARVAVATGSRDAGAIARARSLGAVGFVQKSGQMSEIVAAVRLLIAGEECFPVEDFADPDDPAVKLLQLTPSQMRMVIAAASGQINKQIAYDSGLSEATVKAHLAAAFKKLGVNNRTLAGLMVRSLSVEDR